MVTITPGIMSIGNATPDVNMMSRPNGSVQVRCAPRAELNRPSAVP